MDSKGNTVSAAYVCPAAKPVCSNYVPGQQWGTCTAAAAAPSSTGQCAADYGKTVDSKGNTVSASYVCPADTPVCSNYVPGQQWGTCVKKK